LNPPGNSESSAFGINASGQVVGEWTAPGPPRAFLYSGGKMTDLGTLGGLTASAAAINDAGQIVGTSAPPSSPALAFLFSGGKMTSLGALGVPQYSSSSGIPISGATAINASGQVVGSSSTQQGGPHAFLYSGGKMTDLGTLGGYSYATGINASGQVVGLSDLPGGRIHAFLSDGKKMTDLGTLPGQYFSTANGINDAGQVVGSSSGLGPGFHDHAVLFVNGKVTDLNSLIAADSHWILESATAINNSGQIVGNGTAPDGERHAFLLTPVDVPEPSGLALLGLGALGLAGRAWRKSRRADPSGVIEPVLAR
jgi:probable HAF family extracellular repeat protein